MTTGLRYLEHESSNEYRNFPFAENANVNDEDGVPLATDVFVDSILYPIVDEETRLYLTLLDMQYEYVEVRTESGSVLSGHYFDGVVELTDSMSRHAGTLVCGSGWTREAVTGRLRSFKGIEFSAFTCCPIVHSGVYSLSNASRTEMTGRRDITLKGDDCITPVVAETALGPELSFDVQFDPAETDSRPVRQLLFAVVGPTVFDIAEQSDNTALLSAPQLDRDDVCWQAHREDSVAVVVDTCESEDPTCPTSTPPYKNIEVYVCPSDVGSINIVSDDGANYRNSLLVSTEAGVARPQVARLVDGMTADEMLEEGARLAKRPVQSGNAIRITMPGLGNGR